MAETSGLLNRRTGDSRTEGSNPSVSASGNSASHSQRPDSHISIRTASDMLVRHIVSLNLPTETLKCWSQPIAKGELIGNADEASAYPTS